MEQGVYQYDALGRRFQKTSKGQITKYFNDGWSVLFETNQTGALSKSYVLGPRIDEILQSAGQNYLYDGLGSVTGLANSSGAKSATYGYDVFGSLRFKSGASANANNYLFTGRELDPESALYNYRNRYYNPSVGRFLTKDPAGLVGGVNYFVYVKNNPINYADSLGLFLDTGKARQIAEKTLKEVKESPMPGKLNGEADAYRHCLWSCRMRMESGSFDAWVFGTGHELWDNRNEPDNQKKMDLNNNWYGRTCQINKGDSCEQKCSEALQSGQLTTITPANEGAGPY